MKEFPEDAEALVMDSSFKLERDESEMAKAGRAILPLTQEVKMKVRCPRSRK